MKTRYILLFSLCILAALKGFGQQKAVDSFVLNGKTGDKNLDSVSIIYINGAGKIIQETVAAINGDFRITGLINQPTFSHILFKHKGEVIGKRDVELKRNTAYLNPGEMIISKVPPPNGYLEISGSPAQEEWKTLYQKTKANDKSIDSLTALLSPANHSGQGNAADNKLKASIKVLKAKQTKENYDYFVSHPDSYVTADRIKYFTSAMSLDSIKAVYGKFSPRIKASVDGGRLAAEIKAREAGRPGTIAFPFEVKDRSSKDLSLVSLKGKYVLLDFWATWCVPCRASMPHMISLYKKYKGDHFELIGIGDDDRNVKNWEAAIDSDGTGLWPQTLRGLDTAKYLKGIDNPRDLGQQYGVRALPTKILIDPQGKIVGRFDGQNGSDEEMEKMLTDLIKL